MNNDVFFCTAKVFAESGATYSFGNSTQTKEYCISIHTESEKIHIFIARDEYEVIDVISGALSDIFEQCIFFQKFKSYVLNEMMLIVKIKAANTKVSEVKLLGPVNPNAKGSQFLWRKGTNYIVTSWAQPPMGAPVEILGFIADEDGKIQDWVELAVLNSVQNFIENHRIVAERALEMLR